MDVRILGGGPHWVVALHGIQGTNTAWEAVARHSASCRFLLPNLRGRGAAMRGDSPRDYTLDRYADDVAQAVAALPGEAPYFLAGWSLGVSVALAYVSRHVARPPRGLVLASGSVQLHRTPWFRGEGDALMQAIAERERRLGLAAPADRRSVALTWMAVRDSSQVDLLGTIGLPTLVLHGARDTDCPPDQGRLMAQHLRHAELLEFPEAGHGLLSEASAGVAQAIDRHVLRHGAARATGSSAFPTAAVRSSNAH